MKKILLNILIAGILASFSSCFDDPGTDIVWESALVEFEGATKLSPSSAVYIRFNDGTTARERLQVNLVGAQIDQPVTINFEVDQANTTAIEGVHYSMVSSGSIQIPAGDSFGFIEFDVLPDNFDETDEFTIAFNMTSVSVEGIDVSPNFSSVEHFMSITCPFTIFDYASIAGDYTVTSDGASTDPCPADNPNDDYVYTSTVTITLESETDDEAVYSLSEAFGGLYQVWYCDCYSYCFETSNTFTIDKATGEISGAFDSAFGPDKGFLINGQLNSCNGEFTINWTNVYGDNGSNTYVKQ